ncbi:Dak phosphatase [Thermacetogenium phaeum DSM 12270]|uniref:Dak phosphatase n=1 Tax=Thermacetogenium phaeum (strain ATCC BAA-254 / DSM 26808 / PB) TaxID=1089553 RepID=K4LGX5_THEPS|nr:DAK2 domain-containing protein [Thermacetogenium phaeum]AFV11220.1 Dak phosphatase [Thermacetogenium phaeum DSM 12270]
MDHDVVTGEQVRQLFLGGLAAIAEHQKEIDRLNVFPVPDGDTGRNMYLTMAAAVKELDKVNGVGIGSVGEAVARGSLLGARGNSGVILSQLIRGLADSMKGKERISVQEFAQAWQNAVSSAYRAVIKPVEGTMLTVARGFTQGMNEAAVSSGELKKVLAHAIQRGYQTLRQTPEMLPALKKAGVVDAGGKGLLVILEGGLQALGDGMLQPAVSDRQQEINVVTPLLSPNEAEDDFTYLYCTEFLLKASPSQIQEIKKEIEGLGGSLVTGNVEDYIKVHIHTNYPGRILDRCQRYGTLHNIQISNMRDQYEESRTGEEEKDDAPPVEDGGTAEVGIVAVAAGEGIKNILLNLGVARIIEGGQTMNPPVEDFIQAIAEVPARQVIVLPNNKNLVMAAEQAKQMISRPVEIVPSTSIPAGISALLAFNDSLNLEENVKRMCQQLECVKTGEVTYAVRDAVIGDQRIKEGDIVAIYRGEVVASGSSLEEAVLALLERMVEERDELVTLYSGAGVELAEMERIANRIRDAYPDVEVDAQEGGQPVYYFLISVE